MICAVITRKVVSFDVLRRAGDHNRIFSAFRIDIAGTDVQRLLQITDQMSNKPQGISFGKPRRRTRRTQRADRRVNHVNDVCGCGELDGVNVTSVVTRAVQRQIIKMPDAVVFVAQIAAEGLGILIGNHDVRTKMHALYRIRPGRDTGQALARL